MIKHIVCWKIKNEIAYKSDVLNEIKNRLLSLTGKIKEIVSIEVGINDEAATGDNYDIILVSEFYNFDDLKSYAENSYHKDVGVYIKSVTEQRVAIDYKI